MFIRKHLHSLTTLCNIQGWRTQLWLFDWRRFEKTLKKDFYDDTGADEEEDEELSVVSYLWPQRLSEFF